MKNLILITIVILIASVSVKAQETGPKPPHASDIAVVEVSSNTVFSVVEQEPEFKGGAEAFYKYLQQSIHYPAKAVKNHIQGTVFVSFIVEKDGSLSNIRLVRSIASDINVARSIATDIDAEALRVIKASPSWNPGMQNGRTVRVVYTTPINFTLEDH
jgi:periplasmic protein TonB